VARAGSRRTVATTVASVQSVDRPSLPSSAITALPVGVAFRVLPTSSCHLQRHPVAAQSAGNTRGSSRPRSARKHSWCDRPCCVRSSRSPSLASVVARDSGGAGRLGGLHVARLYAGGSAAFRLEWRPGHFVWGVV
jgi:hypothetical protein